MKKIVKFEFSIYGGHWCLSATCNAQVPVLMCNHLLWICGGFLYNLLYRKSTTICTTNRSSRVLVSICFGLVVTLKPIMLHQVHTKSTTDPQQIEVREFEPRQCAVNPDLLTPVADIPARSALHASSCGDLVIPRTCRWISDRACSVAAPRAWNRLSTDLKLLRSIDRLVSQKTENILVWFCRLYGHEGTGWLVFDAPSVHQY